MACSWADSHIALSGKKFSSSPTYTSNKVGFYWKWKNITTANVLSWVLSFSETFLNKYIQPSGLPLASATRSSFLLQPSCSPTDIDRFFSWFFCFFLSYPRSNVGVLCFLLRFEIQSSILWQNLNGTFAIFGVENWSLEWLREGNWSLGISFLLTCPFPPFKNLSNLVGNKTVVLIRWLFQLFNLKIPAVFLRRVGMGLLWDYWQANLAVFWNGLSLCCL